MALSRAHISAKATDVAELLLSSKRRLTELPMHSTALPRLTVTQNHYLTLI